MKKRNVLGFLKARGSKCDMYKRNEHPMYKYVFHIVLEYKQQTAGRGHSRDVIEVCQGDNIIISIKINRL